MRCNCGHCCHHEVSMSLGSPTDYEIGGNSLHMVLPSTRRSRARGNPGLFSAELAWVPTFAGMTECRRPLHSTDHRTHGFSKEDTKITKFRLTKFRNFRVLRGESRILLAAHHFWLSTSLRKRQSMILSSVISSVSFSCSFANLISESMVLLATSPSGFNERNA